MLLYYQIIFPEDIILAKVLVVDDSSIMRRNLSTILVSAGHIIVGEAANGETGVKEYKLRRPDLVTMDITMPLLDGINAVKQIIEFDPDAQIIMISSLDQKRMVLTALQNGARHYIIKPFSPEKVLDVITEVLNTSKGKYASGSEKLQGPSVKRQKSVGVINNTISEIDLSIKSINGMMKELDTGSK
jgi:two-component system chemotaxis response regulator CheY